MKATHEIIKKTFDKYEPAVSFSGGGDSMVLLDIILNMGYKPDLIYADSQMEYGETIKFVKSIAKEKGLKLYIAKHDQTPLETWKKYGYPFLGKQSAREWMRRHSQNEYGFKLDVSTCCRKMKILPARKKLKELGLNCQITGQRGNADDRLRGMRAFKDGVIKFVKADKIYISNPLTGWTDNMVKRYTENHRLKKNPIKERGGLTIGCMYCGGGAQFTNSGFKILRKTNIKEWEKMINEYGFGKIILAIKYEKPLWEVKKAVEKLGGIEYLMKNKPYVFDYLRLNPLQGYDRK